MLNLIKEIYKTYLGDGEHHRIRIFLSFLIALSLSLAASDLTGKSFNAIALTISVLAGFTFTAIFSNHTLTTADLPPPKNESDRNDIRRLSILGENFRVRSRYFVTLSIFVLCFVVISNFDVDLGVVSAIRIKIEYFIEINFIVTILEYSYSVFRNMIEFFVLFGFFECLYTFYRLSETAMAVTDTRREYISSRV